jgi:glycosyltransferase involved in cell wall biosynthesis
LNVESWKLNVERLPITRCGQSQGFAPNSRTATLAAGVQNKLPIRVGHFSTFDVSGGAARAAYRLHRGLVDAGIQSTMVVASKASSDPTVHLVPRSRNVFSKIRRRLRYGFTAREIAAHKASIARGHDLFSSDRIPGGIQVPDRELKLDVIHLHWISWFIDYEDFFARLPPSLPIVWTLHDMNPFTGGCHYDAFCGRFRDQCGRCPALDSDSPNDLSHRIFQRKAEIFGRMAPPRLHIVTPSRWLGDTARESTLLKRFACTVIPYGLDTSVYKPIERGECRKALDIPLDAKAVLFVADANQNKRKGLSLLLDALSLVRDIPGLVLLSIGGAPAGIGGDIPHVAMGQVRDDRLLASVYSAADVLVIPSLQDNLPNTVLEAMACGTPSVGFDVGGIADMIRPGLTGLLAPPRDVPALAGAIRSLLSDENRGRLGGACRDLAVAEYDLKLQARRYLDLYETLINSAR